MDIASLLADLRRQDIQFKVENGRLKVDAPRGALTETLRNQLRQHKAAILTYCQSPLLAGEIPRQDRQMPQACSFAQQRLWILDRLEGGSTAYHIPLFFNIQGDLQVDVLQQAIHAIVRRHTVLRTVMDEPQGTATLPTQRIVDRYPDLPLLDLRHEPEEVAHQCVQALAAEQLSQPFDLAKDLLLRLQLVQSAEQQHVLLMTLHHCIFDGLSVGLFLQELDVLYQAFRQGQPSPLPELPVQYADYSVWQRQRLSASNVQAHLDFWRETLGDAPPVLNLPIDYPRPARQTHAGARLHLTVDVDTSLKLRELCQQTGSTAFMAFQALLSLLLARYSGQSDIVMGAPVANRNHSQVEALLGLFANTFVLRTRIDPSASFNSLLEQVKAYNRHAYQHQELPFEQLVDALKPERSLGHTPLFQVMYSFQPAPVEHLRLAELVLEPLVFQRTLTLFDLSFLVHEYPGHFAVTLEYSTDLFTASTMQRMAGHLQVLLQAVLSAPQQPVGTHSLLTAADVRQWQAWNDTATDYPQYQTIVSLFEAQVARTPDNTAVVFGNQSLSYRELNARANQVAHTLIAHGVQADTLVGICVERSLEMVIGLLAILKAGGAYVPLDPAYPTERLAFMLADSHVAVLLTQSSLQDRLPLEGLSPPPAVLYLDDESTVAKLQHNNPELRCLPQNLAYVLFTSGSTGKPKGVAIEHHSAVCLLRWAKSTFAPECFQGTLASTSINFDLSVYELFVPLSSGGTVILANNALYLPTLPSRDRCTLINTVPSAIAELLRNNAIPVSVHTINLAGEALQNHLAQALYALPHIQKVYNLYGPSEDTTYSTCALVPRGSKTQPTIGSPIANTRIHILDAQQQPLPLGIPGELCIAGAGLARGYLNRPELTAEKFIELELFGQVERIYRTGDLARWLPDGNLEYLGRIDHQVKLRGFRIELGEIEAVLVQHPDVRECIVLAQENAAGDKQLVAYVCSNGQQLALRLREFLQGKLPDYMLPAYFVVLDVLPLLPNGKLNRKALPQPDYSSLRNQRYMHPRNSLELALSQIWETILPISPIGVFDNFFEIGGDSLLAIRLMSAIYRTLGIRIPQHNLFQHGSIEQLACLLRQDKSHNVAVSSPLVGLQTRGNNAPLFCVHAAGGIVFRYLQTANRISSLYGHPFYGLQAKGLEPGETPYPTIEAMAEHYVQAIRAAKPQGPYLLVGWSMGGTVAFEMARILESMGATVSGVIMIDAPSPFIDSYEEDDIEFLLERLEPAVDLDIHTLIAQETASDAKKLYILEQKKLLGLFAPDIEFDEAERRLRLHKHHNQLLCEYRPAGAIQAKIAFIKAMDATPFDKKMKNPLAAWAGLTHQGLVEYESPGNHFNMFSNEHSPILADVLHECLRALGVSV